MNHVSISEARKEWAKLLDYVFSTKEPVYITRYGKPVAVMVPPDFEPMISENSEYTDPGRDKQG